MLKIFKLQALCRACANGRSVEFSKQLLCLWKSHKIIHTHMWKDFFLGLNWKTVGRHGVLVSGHMETAISSSLYTKGSLRSVSPLPAIKTASLLRCVVLWEGDTVLLSLHFGPFHDSRSPQLASEMDMLSPGWQSQHLGGFRVGEHFILTPFPWEGVKTAYVLVNWVAMPALIYYR